jgi:hypothetical protein
MLAALVASLYLPFGAIYYSVQPAGASLLVSGFDNPGRGCVWLTVGPATLGASTVRGSCARPARSSYPAVPVVIPNPRSQWQDVRIALVGKTVTWSPVVFRFEDASDTRPLWTYGGGSLWLYDVSTTKGSEALRFSAATGRLEQTIAMPKLFRPVIAANADGLWLVAAVNGGVSGQYPAALYHVAPGAGEAVVVHREGRAALWMSAHAHTVWAELISGTSSAALWRFDGPAAKARRLTRQTISTATVATYGDGSLWGVAQNGRRCTITRIDPGTGRETRVATVQAMQDCGGLVLDPAAMTFFRGALYFLDAPRLYRIRP